MQNWRRDLLKKLLLHFSVERHAGGHTPELLILLWRVDVLT